MSDPLGPRPRPPTPAPLMDTSRARIQTTSHGLKALPAAEPTVARGHTDPG